MSETLSQERPWRDAVLADPEGVLDDAEVMRALVGASEAARGANVIDIRGAAMAQLERQLTRLEETHNTVVSNAYANVAGTSQIQRAVLTLLEPADLSGLRSTLEDEVQAILRVDALHLMIESAQPSRDGRLHGLGAQMVAPGALHELLGGRNTAQLRPISGRRQAAYGRMDLRSEALLPIAPAGIAAVLVMASRDPEMFAPGQGTDLLTFFSSALERRLAHFLA